MRLEIGIPDDAQFVVHGFGSNASDPAWVAFERALRRLGESGIQYDLIDLATTDMSQQAREQVRTKIDAALGALGRVRLGAARPA